MEAVTHYKAGDPVILYVNKVGPYHNPQETYHYYQLPVCCPEKIATKASAWAKCWMGTEWQSLCTRSFRENVEKRVLCHMQLQFRTGQPLHSDWDSAPPSQDLEFMVSKHLLMETDS